jgi:hypothetical protein
MSDVEAPTFCLDNRLTDGSKAVSPTRRPPFTPQEYSVRGWVDPRAIVRLEGLGKLKKKNQLIRSRTHVLSAWSIVPQPATLPRAPATYWNYVINNQRKHAILKYVCAQIKWSRISHETLIKYAHCYIFVESVNNCPDQHKFPTGSIETGN